MSGLLRDGAAWTGAALVALTALGLVAYDVFRDTGWRDWLGPVEGTGGEIREFVLFTNVPYKDWSVMTGVQYASTRDRTITDQWCYLNANARFGTLATRLALAKVSADGKKTVHMLTPAALREFDLTYEAARGLVDTHCRFQ